MLKASGGPGSKDPRTRIVTWSVIAGSWGPEGFVSLGSLSGVEPPGTSVIQGEAKALAQLLKNTEGEAQVAVDSKGAISQQESKVQKSNHYPAWYGCFPDRGRLTCHWLSSHTNLESFLADHGESSSWQWHANQAADAPGGRRALEVFSQQHVAWVARADKLCLEVNRFLAARVKTILTADPPPPAMRVLQKKDRNGGRHPSAQHKPKAPQPRPAADGGKNKKQRMEDMVASSARGHQFEWTSKNPNNSSIQCLLCTLYVQQVAPLDVFARYELQECRDRPMPWPDYWPKPADHKMHNLGALWSCEVCHACIRVAAKKFPQKLLNPCKGMPRRRVGGFGLLMPTPGPSLLPDRPAPQARARQNKPKAKAGASLKPVSLFKPSCADPSVCSQGNSSLCSLSCRSATHDPGPQLLPSSRR